MNKFKGLTIEQIKIKSYFEYLNKLQPLKLQIAVNKMMRDEGVI